MKLNLAAACAAIGLLAACGSEPRAANPSPTSSVTFDVSGIHVEGFEGTVSLRRVDGLTTIGATGATIEIHEPVRVEYRLAAGGLESETSGAAAPLPADWIRVEGGLMRVADGHLSIGDVDFGTFAPGDRAVITADGVRVGGDLRGALAK